VGGEGGGVVGVCGEGVGGGAVKKWRGLVWGE
jgi:hypothetical protein